MAMNLSGNIMANQANNYVPYSQPMYPSAQGSADITSPFGVGEAMIKGVGSAQIGPYGVATSVPFAPGFAATAANTINGLGMASPFATTSHYLHNISQNSFGQTNPYSPLIGTPNDLNNNDVMVSGAFGGYQNPSSIYAGSGLPQSLYPDGSYGYGGPGGSQAGNFTNSLNYGGGAFLGAQSVPMAGHPMGGMAMQPTMPSAYPAQGGGQPYNSSVFLPTSPNVLSGGMQQYSVSSGDYQGRYNLITDGVAKLFMQGQDTGSPRQTWGAGSTLRSGVGIYETGVGWAGGNANAGLFGSQAAGMAWAKVSNPLNPAMVISYANPYYNNYNFNQGFTNG